MRRTFVAQDDSARPFGLSLGFTHHQHFDPRGQAVDLFGLLGHGVGQVVRDAQQMRDAFFESSDIHVPSDVTSGAYWQEAE